MNLAELLRRVATIHVVGNAERDIRAVQYDSRRVEQGDIFVAIHGLQSDGNAFIQMAVARGAAAVVTDERGAFDICEIEEAASGGGRRRIVKILVLNARVALAEIANALYGFPTRDVRLIGVTGTNGKTTTTHVVRHFLESAGVPAGLIGTIESRFGETAIPMEHTTPESLELCGIISMMKEQGAQAVVMEVSSHALALERVHGFEFDAAVLTNITQDHLDFHGTMEAYADAKARLFEMLEPGAAAIINADEPYGEMMERRTRGKVIRYGVVNVADVRAEEIALSTDGTSFQLTINNDSWAVFSPYLGMFNVYNVLAGVAAAIVSDVPVSVIVERIASLPQVRGRMERMILPNGAVAVVDFAHTPDALQRAIETLRISAQASGGKLITVFGCGGDRDRTKRPIMGAIAARLSDATIITSDNPRTEDPMAIIAEVLEGIPAGAKVSAWAERGEAVDAALAMANRNDVVLIAGKGHESYQIIGEIKYPYDDVQTVREWIDRVNNEQHNPARA